MTDLRVFTFGPTWGLPTNGPFALKLLAWLRLAGISFEQVVENISAKGPRGKSPWIERGYETMGDSGHIIETLAAETGFDLDGFLDPVQQAEGLAWQRLFEEHMHQILEWELFCHPNGSAHMRQTVRADLPPIVGGLVFSLLQRHFAKQLYARGIGRQTPEQIAAQGVANREAFSARLGTAPFLFGTTPSLADLAAFGQLGVMVKWPFASPVADHAKSTSNVVAFTARMLDLCGFAGKNADVEP